MNPSKTEQFILKANKKHNGFYVYDRVEYISCFGMVEVECPLHGYFNIKASSHLVGRTCPLCAKERIRRGSDKRIPKKKTTEQFIEAAKMLHDDRYDYTETIYIKATDRLKVKCNMHQESFMIYPNDHLKRGGGCKKCGITRTSNSKRYDTLEFKQLLETKHGPEYSYDKLNYIDCHTPVTITCNKHGDFKILPQSILKSKCPKCVKEEHAIKYRMTLEEFKCRSEKAHGSKYGYHEVDYLGCDKRVKILCKKHNEFFYQLPSHHIRGVGCPRCKESKGEVAIRNYLIDHSINFTSQHSTPECKNEGRLYFDFAILLDNKILIVEFNGLQHYKAVKYFGGIVRLKRCQENDNIKKEYCIANNIPMLIIKYNEFNEIASMLDDFIKSNS